MRIRDWSSDVCSSDLVSVTGVAFGLALAVLRAVRRPWLSVPIVIFADVMRSLPPLVVIIIFFFAFPLIDLPMSSFTAVWLSLSLVLAAFAEECIWGGIQAVPLGQAEAARSTKDRKSTRLNSSH